MFRDNLCYHEILKKNKTSPLAKEKAGNLAFNDLNVRSSGHQKYPYFENVHKNGRGKIQLSSSV